MAASRANDAMAGSMCGKTAVVFGGSGLAGSAVVEELKRRGATVVSVRSAAGSGPWTCDIRVPDQILEVLMRAGTVHYVVNCAAFSSVDGCDGEKRMLAYEVNGIGPYNLALACRHYPGSPRLVHVSTNFVDSVGEVAFFSTPRPENYCCDGDFSELKPVNSYGRMKLCGEMAVASAFGEDFGYLASIVRTSWLFGPGRNTFADYVADTAIRGGKQILVPRDEHSMPTSTSALAAIVADTLESENMGKFVAGCCGNDLGRPGFVSKYEYADAVLTILRDLGYEIPENSKANSPIILSTRDCVYKANGLAERPEHSSMFFSGRRPYWKAELYNYLEEKYGRAQ